MARDPGFAVIGRLCLLLAVAGCGGGSSGTGVVGGASGGPGGGSAGRAGSGGSTSGSGGAVMTGSGGVSGPPGTGGHPSAGGGASGSAGTGGAVGGSGSGGAVATGGASSSGGAGGRGGSGGNGGLASGGAPGTGGRGGSTASGGTSGTAGRGGAPTGGTSGRGGAGGGALGTAGTVGGSTVIAGCSIFPANHIFNTPIDSLPVDPHSADYLATIGDHNLHLDLGTTTSSSMPNTYYGIPYNVVHDSTVNWAHVYYQSADPELDWDPRPESDCLDFSTGPDRNVVSPCTDAAAAWPVLPIPLDALVEGGPNSGAAPVSSGDAHILMLYADDCRLYEAYHSYPRSGENAWNIFGSAIFELRSNALRPDGWTSADAAGFPILPLLLRADDINSGSVRHALRFTVTSSKIRNAHVWPARHQTSNGTTSTNLPPMGQLFRLKASYAIPSSFTGQARVIAQALKTYGMYIADGGSDMYITGEPNVAWSSDTISQVQTINSSQFEAVDLTPIHQRAGFDANSAAVPPP